MPCLVAFGDSLTRGYGVPLGAGWVELLAERLKDDKTGKAIPVFNAGGNGNTSTEGLNRIESDVLVHMPGLVLVEFGGNDVVHDARAVSVDQFKDNLLTIIKKIRSRGGAVALLTLSPIINEWHAWSSDPYYARWGGIDQCIEQYRQANRDVAKLQTVPLFDLDRFLRPLIAEKGQTAFILPDGVHLTPAANQLIADAVLKFLKNPTEQTPHSS